MPHVANSGSFKKGMVPWNKGKRCPQLDHTEEQKKHKSELAKKNGHGKWRRGMVPWNKGKPNPNSTGEKNPNWKGGITLKTRGIRFSKEYARWRKQVFERDSYTCQFCGVVGGPLNADHIKPFLHRPDLVFDLDNGRTLCVPCHKQTDTYGTKARNWKEIEV